MALMNDPEPTMRFPSAILALFAAWPACILGKLLMISEPLFILPTSQTKLRSSSRKPLMMVAGLHFRLAISNQAKLRYLISKRCVARGLRMAQVGVGRAMFPLVSLSGGFMDLQMARLP